jgi:hypothetical protein
MKVIRVNEIPPQVVGERDANAGLPAAGNAHN